MFFVGGWILSTCSKWEREDAVKLKDPKLMYGHRKSDIVKTQKHARSIHDHYGITSFGFRHRYVPHVHLVNGIIPVSFKKAIS